MKKIRITILVLLLLANMTIQQHRQIREEVETSVNEDGNPFSYVVPGNEAAQVGEYGFTFWVKPSYMEPIMFKFDTFVTHELGLAGIHENTRGYCPETDGRYGGALNIQLMRGNYSNLPTYIFKSYNQLDPNDEERLIEYPSREDFNNKWNFVYAAYSYVESKAYAYVYFTHSDSTSSVIWQNNQKRFPAPDLKFRLGGCDPYTRSTFQGLFRNVQFFYGPSGSNLFLQDIPHVEQFRQLSNTNFLTQNLPTADPVVEHAIGNDVVTFSASQNKGQQNVFLNLQGPQEYAVWGWAQWTEPNQRSRAHLLFRLTTDEPGELQDDDKIGDRTLACFIEEGRLGFSTYTFHFSGTQSESNYYQSIDLETFWFFVYFGYSDTLHQATAYTYFDGLQYILTWDNVYHMLPMKAVLQLGKDDFHRAFNGDMKNWNFGYGPGTYDYVFNGFESIQNGEKENIDYSFQLQENGPVDSYESSFRQVEPVYRVDVPDNELNSVEDVSFSLWFKWNYQYPDYASLEELENNMLSLVQVSETGSHGIKVGDRVLSVWMRPLQFGQKTYFLSTYAINKSRYNWGQDCNVRNEDDFDSAWTWLYFAYTPFENALFSYMRFASGEVVILTWEDVVHNYPIQGLHFSVGKALNSQFSFNGFIYNVQFNYLGQSYVGTRDEVEDYYFNRVTRPNMQSVAYQNEQLYQQETSFVDNRIHETDIYSTYDGSNSRQYCVYGWFKWVTFGDIQNQHALFRLTTQEEDAVTDNNKPGDRTLVYYVSNGVLVANTYTYSFTSSEFNVKHATPYEDDLESWFWVYFGYDYTQKQALTFILFYDRIEQMVFNGVVHQLPHRLRFTVGNDKYLNSWNGQIRDINLAWNEGAYQSTNLDRLYGTYLDANQPQLPIDNFWNQDPILINSNANEESEFEYVVDRQNINQVTQYSFSFWWRFSFYDPQRVSVATVRDNWIAFAGVTERDGYYESGMGGKTLSCYMRPLQRSTQPTLQFSTYATNRNQDYDFKDMPFSFDSLDSQWNWLYFGYDYDLQRAYATVVFGNGEVQTLDWEQTVHQRPQQLKFQLGKARGDQAIAFNGQFYDVRFRYDNLAYKEGANVRPYFLLSVPQPPNFTPFFSRVLLIQNPVSITQNVVARQIGFASRFRGSREYSVYGWAKWIEKPQREPLHSLFRLTTNSPSNQGNHEYSGDRSLACFVSQTQLIFATYNVEQQGGDDWNIVQSVDFDDDLTAWFFVYFGYSKNLQRATAFIQFQDQRQLRLTFDNINQLVPRYIGVFLGKDNFYPAFAGQLKGWVVSGGQGAYQEANFESLMVLQEDISDNVYYETSTNQIVDEEHPVTTLYEESIHPDLLQTSRIFTGWTWFQWNYNIPSYFGHPSQANDNCYHIFRLIKGSSEGLFTDLCFTSEGIPHIKFTEVLGGVENIQLSQLPSFDDLDSSWNFVYVSHNEDTQTSIAYIYYSNAQQRFVYTFSNSVWNFPTEYMRLKLGGGVTTTNRRRLFNGRFFDAQISTFWNYYGNTTEQIQYIQTLITIIPLQFMDNDIVPAIRISFTLREDGLVETTDETNQPVLRTITEFTNLRQYAIYGWVRWVGYRDLSRVRIIYRINQHALAHAGDASQPGDRSLTLFLTENGRLRFSTYHFEGEQSNYDLSNEVDLDVTEYLGQWFFVYHGYSYEQRRNYFYLRFANGTEYEHQMDNIRHVQSSYYGIYLGRDWLYQPWRGQFYAFAFQVGDQTYVQTLEEVRNFMQLATPVVVIPTEFDENIEQTGGDVQIPQTDRILESDESGYDADEERRRQREANQTTENRTRSNEIGWVTTNNTQRARIEGNSFINSWEGYSYFYAEFSLNQQYKLTVVSGVQEGSKICFGYIPLEMVQILRDLDSRNERYNEYSISICSDNEVNQCHDGAGNCTGGLFDTRPRSTFLWEIREEIAEVKQIVVEGNSDCEFLSFDSTEQQNYVSDDHCTYRDTLFNYYFRQNRRTHSHPYQCQFGKKVICLANHEFEVEWVPYIELKGDITVELNRDAFGEYDVVDENNLPCQNITNTTTIQISCPAPPPRRCDDQFDQSQLQNQDWSTLTDTVEIYSYDLIHDGQYASLDNADGNFYVTLNQDVPNGDVCFGYITSQQQDQFLNNPDTIFSQNTISVCTNGAKNNFGSPIQNQRCVGTMPFQTGTTFNLTVQLDFVQITDVNTRHFQCNFTRSEFRDDLIPWIQISSGATVFASLSGIGQIEDLDCGYPSIPEPPVPPRTCDDMFRSSEVNDQWFSGAAQSNIQGPIFTSISGEQLISPQNPNANFLLRFVDEVVSSEDVCFGYVDASSIDVAELTSSQRLRETLSVCSDGSKTNFYSNEPQNILCQGVLNRTAGSTFNVTVQWNSVQITATDQHFQCNLWYDNTIQLVPWVFASGYQTLDIQQTGIGKVDSRECTWPYIQKPRDCDNFFDPSYLTDNSWFYSSNDSSNGLFSQQHQYVLLNNNDANYEITIEETESDICFGYILSSTAELGIAQSLQFANTFAVCLDGSVSNRNQDSQCYGTISSGLQQRFNLTVQPDWVQITSFDRYFQCNITTSSDSVVPWVHVRSGQASAVVTGVGKVLCFYYPYYRRVCEPDFTDDHQLIDYKWFDRSTDLPVLEENTITNSQPQVYNQYISKNNINANYNITINSNFVQGKDVCFGYIETSNLGSWSQFNSFESQTVSLCTNGNFHNAGSTIEGVCNGRLLYSTYTEFKVTVLSSSIQITNMDSHFQCNFARNNILNENLIPWIQVHSDQSVGVLLWGIGYLECPTPFDPPVIPTVIPKSCLQHMFDTNLLVDNNWNLATDHTQVSLSFAQIYQTSEQLYYTYQQRLSELHKFKQTKLLLKKKQRHENQSNYYDQQSNWNNNYYNDYSNYYNQSSDWNNNNYSNYYNQSSDWNNTYYNEQSDYFNYSHDYNYSNQIYLTNFGEQQFKSYLSFNNPNGNYLITLNNQYSQYGVVCFGFVLDTERNQVNSYPFQSQSVSICTDGSKHNYNQNPINDIHCQGEFVVQSGNQFNVTVLWEKVQVTSIPDRYFQCNFTRNSRVEVLLPWVQISSRGGQQTSVLVQLTGIGKIYNDGSGSPECECGYNHILPPSPFVPSCDNSFYHEELVVNQNWINNAENVFSYYPLYNPDPYNSFVSLDNPYGNFNVTLKLDQEPGDKVCFGVIPFQSINMAFEGVNPNSNITQGLCTNGQTMNYVNDKSRDICWGLHNIKNTSRAEFTVFVNSEKIQITQDDHHVHCEFWRDDTSVRLFPWVYIKSRSRQVVSTHIFGYGNVDGDACNNYYIPFVLPPPPTPQPPPPTPYVVPTPYVYPTNCTRELMEDTSTITNLNWQSGQSQYSPNEIQLNSAQSQRQEWVSQQNENRIFQVKLQHNMFAVSRQQVCFGYIQRSRVAGSLMGQDNRENSISLCTNGDTNNFHAWATNGDTNNFMAWAGGIVECTNRVLLQKALSKGTTYRVDLLYDRVQISTYPYENTYTQCNFYYRQSWEQQFDLVPWIQLSGSIGLIQVIPTFKGFGYYQDPFQACPVQVAQFVRPNCETDFYDPLRVRDNNWMSNNMLQSGILESSDNHLNFVSINNYDTNFNLTVPVGGGQVCFGYVSSDALPLATSGQKFSIRSNTISICIESDTTFSTNSFELNGDDRNVQVLGGPTFSLTRTEKANQFIVYLNTHRVQISSADRQFQINFNRADGSLQVFPWVQFSLPGQLVLTTLYGIGKIDGNIEREVSECNIEFLPPLECPFCLDEYGQCVECIPPPLHLCHNTFFNEELNNQVWYQLSTRNDITQWGLETYFELTGPIDTEYETYLSPQNRNGNYKVELKNNYVGGSICFGYILASQETELYATQGSFHRSTISLCTSGQAYNVFSESSENVYDQYCSGRLQTNENSQYKVSVGQNLIQISAYPQLEFQCNFTIPDSFGYDQNLLPWVQIQRSSSLPNSIQVDLNGLGRPIDNNLDCIMGFHPIPFTCSHQFYSIDLVDNLWYRSFDRSVKEYLIDEPGQYISEYNQNGNYYISLDSNSDSKTCFGFLPQRYSNQFYGVNYSQDDLSQTISICNDGTLNNVEGEYTCTGNMNEPGDHEYIVTVLANSVQITAVNKHYQCNFMRNQANKNILPWVLTTSNIPINTVVFGLGKPDENDESCIWRFIQPVIQQIQITCENSFYNISKVTERWESASAKGDIISTGQLQGSGQYLSPNNTDGNYIIEFNHLVYNQENYLCFGYVQRQHIQDVYENPDISSLNYAMAVCTNGRGYNYQDPEHAFAQCLGDFRKTNSSIYIVTVRRNNVQITADNNHLQCNLTLSNDDRLVPWIQTTSDEQIRVRFFGQGRPVQNEPNCTLPYDPLPLTPLPPPPRTCDDFYTYRNYELEDVWVGTLNGERLTEGILFNNDPEGIEFVSPNNDTNYRLQIHEFTGQICFGYVEYGGLHEERASTSICFTNEGDEAHAFYTHGPSIIECNGNFTYAEGSTFNVTVLESNVSITHTHRIFQCNFTRIDNTPTLLPYVKIGEQANIEYRLLSKGKWDCPEPFEPLRSLPPREYLCDQTTQNNQWKQVNPEGSAVRIITTLDNDNDAYHTEYYSDNEGNYMASFTVQLSNTYSGNKVCFGYVNKDDLFEITSNPGYEHSLNAVSVCTDNTHNPSSTSSGGQCVGELNAQPEETFQIHLYDDQILFQSTSVADQFSCTFERDSSQVHVPWVEIHGVESVNIAFTGCEIVVTRDCRDFVDSSQTVPEWQDAATGLNYQQFYSTNTLTHETLISFGSENNLNANYEISFPTAPLSGSVCFGYTSQDDWSRIRNTPTNDNTDKAAAVCFVNGGIQEFNAYGSGSCEGKPRIRDGSEFFVSVLNNQTQITSLPDRHFQCNFVVPEELNLVPWIQLNNNNAVTTYFVGVGKLWCPEQYVSYETPLPYTCLNRTWNNYDQQLSGEALFASTRFVSQFVQQIGNRDESFEVVLNEDHEYGRFCFGYISQTQASEVYADEFIDISASAHGVCTDQPYGPAHGQCSGKMVLTAGSRFLIYTKNGRFTVREDDPITGYPVFQCYFNQSNHELPWIEIEDTQETLTVQMTCTSYETPIPVVYACYDRTWTSNVLSYVPSTSILSVQAGSGQFAQPDNVNENYTVQILETQGDNFVCFGYVPRDYYSPLDVYLENTLTFCTNNNRYNPYSDINCEGNFNIQRGQEFWVSINQDGNRITIRQSNDEFRCDFNGPVQGYVPFVYLQEITQLQAVINCNQEFPGTPTPVPRTCDRDFFDESQLNDREWRSGDGDISFGPLTNIQGTNKEYYSQNNADANFDVTFSTSVIDGKVCFGYVSSLQILRINAQQVSEQIIAVCSDGSIHNYQEAEQNACQGRVQDVERTTYYVYVNVERIQITSNDQHFQCNFPIVSQDPLIPWVQLSGAEQNVDVYLTGIGRLSGSNCELEYIPLNCPQQWETRSTNGIVDETHTILYNSGDEISSMTNFVSPNNIDYQFTVTLDSDQSNLNGYVCFGYVTPNLRRVIVRNPDDSYQSRALSVCTDGTHYNYLGELLVNCQGELHTERGTSFYVSINSTTNEVNIGDMNNHFHCEFTINSEDILMPWVGIQGNLQVIVENTCFAPTRVPTPPVPVPPPPPPTCTDQWNHPELVTQEWYPAFSYQRTFTFDNYLVSQSPDYVHFVADDQQNLNALYKINLNEDYEPNSKVCFGYITEHTRALISSQPYEDLANSAIGICTDGTLHNQLGQISCNQEFTSSWPTFNEGTLYRVVNYEDKVEMWTINGEVQCQFTKTLGRNLVPWIQFYNRRSVSVELTGRGGLSSSESCEEPPQFVCTEVPEPEPSQCAVLFSQCNFGGVQFNMCDAHGHQELPADQQGAVLSMYLPPGSRVNLGCVDNGQINCGARSLEFGESQRCLDHEEVFHRHIRTAEFIQLNKNPQDKQVAVHKKMYLTKNRR